MFWKWTKRIGLGLVGTLAILAISGALYQGISAKIDAKKYPPIGQLVDVGGYNMHLIVKGSGGPTVVFDSGMGCNALGWSLVQPEVAKMTKTVAFCRPGNGWSDESPLERTSQNIVTELHTALHQANIPGPYILVGHSFGGLNARLFASLYPDEVAGVILVDSAHEDQMDKIPMPQINHKAFMLATHLGAMRLLTHLPAYKKGVTVFPTEIQESLLAQIRTTKFMRTVLQESAKIGTSCDQLKSAGGHLGNKPLIVISATKTMTAEGTGLTQEQIDAFGIAFHELQKDLVTKSSRGEQVFAEESDHMVPLNQPKIIVESVAKMLERI